METWLQVILIVATVEMLLAVILPGIVVYMTLFKTPPEFKHFSLLLLIYSLADATGSFGGWMTFNQRTGVNYPEDHLIVYVSYGLCTVFGPKFCFTLEMLNFIPLMFNLTLTTFNMGYRLYLLHRTAVNFKRISTILFGFAVPWISMTVSKRGYHSGLFKRRKESFVPVFFAILCLVQKVKNQPKYSDFPVSWPAPKVRSLRRYSYH